MFNTLIFLAFLDRGQPPSRGCVLKHIAGLTLTLTSYAAASARLCVETSLLQHSQMLLRQLPSRGCVLKHLISKRIEGRLLQLPPRGCVLKLLYLHVNVGIKKAAASARLCVET